MEFSVRFSKAGISPAAFLVIGQSKNHLKTKYTGLDPSIPKWTGTPELSVGDAILLSGRIVDAPDPNRDYERAMLQPTFTFWARSIAKIEDPRPAIAQDQLTDATKEVLQIGLRLHEGFVAHPDNTQEQDDAMTSNLAKELGQPTEYVSACYFAFTQYRIDGQAAPTEKATTLITTAWGLEN
ncbi:MAG: hypothetical protein P1V35_02620 [Planctomycetota bacterium]|nr:hypothetical protein [Planctomycetota bacterium]